MSNPEQNFARYVTLIYGQSGVGKTTAAASYPSNVFISTEPGTKGLKRYEFNAENGGITSWELFVEAVDILVIDKCKQFKTVTVDSINRLYDFCMEYQCRILGIDHISENQNGKTDRSGKGWTELRKEFTYQLNRLISAGYGLVLTSHVKLTTITSSAGTEYDLIQPSMTGQALDVIRSITDCIFYAEFVKSAGSANDKRILIVQGDELVLAKARGENWGDTKYLPLRKDNAYEIIKSAFEGKIRGINPQDIITGSRTADSARTAIAIDKRKNVNEENKHVSKVLKKNVRG